jgi:hypothetical protein
MKKDDNEIDTIDIPVSINAFQKMKIIFAPHCKDVDKEKIRSKCKKISSHIVLQDSIWTDKIKL